MSYFSITEIIFSIIYAIIYGVAIGSVYQLVDRVPALIKGVLELPRRVLLYHGSIFEKRAVGDAEKVTERRLSEGIKVFFQTVLFFIGYILLSYMVADGEPRLYILLFSLLGLWSSVALKFMILMLSRLLDRLCFVLIVLLRVITFPVHLILRLASRLVYKASKALNPYIPRIEKSKKGASSESGKEFTVE